MEVITLGVFFLSLFGVSALFAFKSWEEKKGTVLAPLLRQKADEQALRLKDALLHSQDEIKRLGPVSLALARKTLHETALGLASLSRASERQAQRLADMVSHKRHFERRETTNAFLQKVSDFKNGRSAKKNESLGIAEEL